MRIPTIGIGAGPDCDGQILVIHDLLGLSFGHQPKFARRYADVGEIISRAAAEYCRDVQQGRFPSDEESYHLPAEHRGAPGSAAALNAHIGLRESMPEEFHADT